MNMFTRAPYQRSRERPLTRITIAILCAGEKVIQKLKRLKVNTDQVPAPLVGGPLRTPLNNWDNGDDNLMRCDMTDAADDDDDDDNKDSEGSEEQPCSSKSVVTRKRSTSSSKSKAAKKPKTDQQIEEDKRKIRRKMTEKLTKIQDTEVLLAKLTEEFEMMKLKYQQTFGEEFENMDEDFDCTSFTTTYNKRDQHQNEKHKFPAGGKCCRVCNSRLKPNFSTDDEVKLCGQCLESVRRNNLLPGEEMVSRGGTYKYREIQCVCPKQLLGQGRPDWRVFDCMRDKLAMIKNMFPKVYTSENLMPADPPVYTQPGHFGHLMDLKTVKRENFTNCPPVGVNTVALLVTVMDLNQKDDRIVNKVPVKGERVLGTVLLTVEYDDPRLDSANGIQTLSFKDAKHAKALGCTNSSYEADADLVHVAMELIEWTPKNPRNAAIAFNCNKMVHYLLNPMLNANQKFQTRVAKMEMQSKYLTLNGINSFMKKRNVDSVGWRLSENPGITLFGPLLATRGGTRRSTTKVASPKDEQFVSNIYAYFVKKGEVVWVNVGSHFGLYPRNQTAHRGTALAKFLSSNPDAEYFSTTLLYLKQNDSDHKLLHEGQAQTIFKFAELNEMTLDQLTLPFPDSGANNNWPDLDKKNLPKLNIQLLNDKIHGCPMDKDEFQFFLNLPKVFFGREFEYPDLYNWENDPLHFTVEPSDEQPMEVEESPDKN